MIRKIGTAFVIGMALFATACDDGIDMTLAPPSVDLTKARIRVANATPTAFDVAINDNAYLGGGNVTYGNSSCAFVDPVNPQLSLKTVATSTTPSTALPNFTMPALTLEANKDYQLVVYPVGTNRTAVLIEQGSYIPTDPAAIGLRAFNAANATGNVDVHLLATTTTPLSSATAKATAIAPGTASAYFDATTNNQIVRFTRSTTPTTNLSYTAPTTGAFTSSTLTIAPPAISTIVLAPAATGTGVRAFRIGGC
jgi:hypothetical protein